MRPLMHPDSIAVRYGLRFGIALAVLGACVGATTELLDTNAVPAVAGVPCCVFVIFIFWLLGEAGSWTAERIGTTSAGALAGAIAGGCGGLATSVGLYVVRLVVQPPHMSTAALIIALGVGIIFGTVVDVFLFVGVGAACGTFGASIGKSKYDRRQAALIAPTLPPDNLTPT
jgi:hypothetical protein